MHGLSGGRRLARERASSDPRVNLSAEEGKSGERCPGADLHAYKGGNENC